MLSGVALLTTLWIHRLGESHRIQVKPVWTSVSLQVITSQKFEGGNAGVFILPSGFLLMHELGQLRLKLMKHTQSECLETSAQVCPSPRGSALGDSFCL